MGILTKHLGCMRRVEAGISPGVQGHSAWSLLTDDQVGHVNAALDDAGKHYKSRRENLQWKIDKGGAIHVRVRPIVVLG